MEYQQLPLFGSEQFHSEEARATDLDADSLELLEAFRHHRLLVGAHPRSVQREVSQLRSLAREAGDRSPTPLRQLFNDPPSIARALTEPRQSISRATGRARFIAVQRFMQSIGPRLGRRPSTDMASLDSLLPQKRPSGWHSASVDVSGSPRRQGSNRPTLAPSDLQRIVATAGASGRDLRKRLRDRALVALLCFSGLRPEEAVRVHWENLSKDFISPGRWATSVALERRGKEVRLLLVGPAADFVEGLRHLREELNEACRGFIFTTESPSMRPLSYRAAREVLARACKAAGLPRMTSGELRAGCAYWMRSQGLSDHEVAQVLGLERVRTVDRLLKRHSALDAQKQVREVLMVS